MVTIRRRTAHMSFVIIYRALSVYKARFSPPPQVTESAAETCGCISQVSSEVVF